MLGTLRKSFILLGLHVDTPTLCSMRGCRKLTGGLYSRGLPFSGSQLLPTYKSYWPFFPKIILLIRPKIIPRSLDISMWISCLDSSQSFNHTKCTLWVFTVDAYWWYWLLHLLKYYVMLSIWSRFDTRVKMEECFIYFYMYNILVFRKHWKACWVYFE